MICRNNLQAAFILLSLTSCVSVSERIENADTMATERGFQKSIIQTDRFKLLAYHRFKQPGTMVSIYIEGDGYAFAGRNRVSSNPTPKNPMALKLALLDDSANVIYLARPCQYIPINDNPDCHFDYWSIKRSAPEVIEAMDQAIEYYKKRLGFETVRLVGYSGGGTIAAILAAQRNDVMDLRTVAGNLDIEKFTRYHNVTPLTGSLNPTDFAHQLSVIPQIHFVGTADDIITKTIIDSYLAALQAYDPDLLCVEIEIMTDVSHTQGWEGIWQQYQDIEIKCK